MTSRNEFSVCQFFADDSYEYLGRDLSDEGAVLMAMQAARSVGARLGTTKRVIITDGGDCVAWEWKHGEGVVYPPELVGFTVDTAMLDCPTCGEPYSRAPSPRASICSNGFHCCRDCTWVDGRCVQSCAYHEDLEGEHCADCARIAEEDGDILPPACARHGGKPPAKRGED